MSDQSDTSADRPTGLSGSGDPPDHWADHPFGTREHDIISAFVELSDELVDDYDVVEVLARLTANCARLLNIASAGLLLADDNGVLHLAASSSERTHHLEVFQLQRNQGPCLECYRDNAPVVVPDLRDQKHRWPEFVDGAALAGFASVHAVPMRLRQHVLGTLGLFGDRVGSLGADDLSLAQALAHVASVAIVNEKAASDRETINTQLQNALSSRIVIEQAKGILAHSGGLEMADAFDVLRGYARDHGRRLSDVARAVVEREMAPDELLTDS